MENGPKSFLKWLGHKGREKKKYFKIKNKELKERYEKKRRE